MINDFYLTVSGKWKNIAHWYCAPLTCAFWSI